MSDDKDRFVLDRRYGAALAAMDDKDIDALGRALEGDLRDALARIAGLPATAFDEGSSLGAMIRDGATRRRTAHDVGVVLGEPCTSWCIEELGAASENPTLEDLNGLLPAAIEKFGLPAVKLMVIQYSRSLKGFRELVATDERFAVAGSAPTAPLREVDAVAQAAQRAARKERKAAEKAARAKQQGRR